MRKYTKWIPLGNFNWDGTDYIVFVRGNKKNGLLSFRNRPVNHRMGGCTNSIIPNTLLDVKLQWDKILLMTNQNDYGN